MNPMDVAKNRTARLVREAATPVYTTATKPVVREHLMAIEWEWDMGGRFWETVPESKVDGILEEAGLSTTKFLSDLDHSAKCWCQK